MSSGKVKIIAEAGVNHNGDLGLAKTLIDVAVEAGADAVKFQTFKADLLVSRTARQCEYQVTNTGLTETQHSMLQKLELSESEFICLAEYCRAKDIEFMSTAFDSPSLHFLNDVIGVERFKIPSGELTNLPFILEHTRLHKPMIISTGMAQLCEVETALKVIAFGFTGQPDSALTEAQIEQAWQDNGIRKKMANNVTVLHCTSQYPADYTEVHLNAMTTMADEFAVPVGYSDHTMGAAVSIAAVACGAKVIEKHFTLDRTLVGPDHAASLEPDEFTNLVSSIRQIELAMGDAIKKPSLIEQQNMAVVRKSIHAARDIKKGEIITAGHLQIKRPGTGLQPNAFWQLVGSPANRDYSLDDMFLSPQDEGSSD